MLNVKVFGGKISSVGIIAQVFEIFYTNFLDNWRVSTERKTHETHIWVCFSTIHQWEEGSKASKGNYILISKNRKHLKLKAPKHLVRPIPPFFSEDGGVMVLFHFLCMLVALYVFMCSLRVRKQHCLFVFAYCLLTGVFTLHRTKAMFSIIANFIWVMHCHGYRLRQVLLVIKRMRLFLGLRLQQ